MRRTLRLIVSKLDAVDRNLNPDLLMSSEVLYTPMTSININAVEDVRELWIAW